MAKQKVLNKNSVKKGDTLVITETVEKTLTLQDLIAEKNQYSQHKQRLVKQMEDLKNQYNQYDVAEKEIDSMIEKLGSELPELK